MNEATLITGLKTQTVHRVSDVARYCSFSDQPLIATDGSLLECEETITEKVVPITRFCRPGKPDLYIAYSDEVEDLLGMPIRILLKEKDQAHAELSSALDEIARLKAMTGWQHLVAAWGKLLSIVGKA